jgi:hypothetical protein
MRLIIAITTISLFYLFGIAGATTLHEADDFSESPASPTLLHSVFDIGTHQVSGSVGFSTGDEYDLFLIALQPGTSLKRIVWESSSVIDKRSGQSYYFATSFISFPDFKHVELDASGLASYYYETSPIEGRSYFSDVDMNFFNLSNTLFGSAAGEADYLNSSWIIRQHTESAFDWTISFEVAQQPVPEPSTSFLLVAGIFLLVFSRRAFFRQRISQGKSTRV